MEIERANDESLILVKSIARVTEDLTNDLHSVKCIKLLVKRLEDDIVEAGGQNDLTNNPVREAEVLGQGDSCVHNGHDHGLPGGLLGGIVCVVHFIVTVIADMIGVWHVPFEDSLDILPASIAIEVEDVLQLFIRVDVGEGIDEVGEVIITGHPFLSPADLLHEGLCAEPQLVDALDQDLQLVMRSGASREAGQLAHLSGQGTDTIFAGLGASPAVVSNIALQHVHVTILADIEIAVQGKHAILEQSVEELDDAINGHLAQTVHDPVGNGTAATNLQTLAHAPGNAVSITHANIGVFILAVGVHVATLGLELSEDGLHAIDRAVDVVRVLGVVDVCHLHDIMPGTEGSENECHRIALLL
ncbi:hypothetical protein PG996_012409 [Apiospora saccharicola]|uniref:Uncharacterized protein n=1 Tax=Apiospora saccharicola TaxID=335842 RepID=A0ABR1U2R5_9PEZI